MWQLIVLSIIFVGSVAYTAYRVYLSLSGKIIHDMAAKCVKNLIISIYAKGNLSPYYNKPLFSHGFSAILRFLWQSLSKSQFAMENGERHGKICQCKIRSWHLINCMINNKILDKITVWNL